MRKIKEAAYLKPLDEIETYNPIKEKKELKNERV